MRFQNAVKSTDTPFVYFVSGTPVYPPNTLYKGLNTALAAAEQKSFQEVLKEFAKIGDVAGQWAVLPEGWWYHFLLTYMNYFRNNFSAPEEMEKSALPLDERSDGRVLFRKHKTYRMSLRFFGIDCVENFPATLIEK